jgi:hypothetical protein
MYPLLGQWKERGCIMPEPREEDDIALGLDEEESEDETYDTLEEKYAD